jgi:hypothetical protein
MAEKRGNTRKLVYDFDTSKCLEVEKNNTWYRVTADTFRSYGGGRRIMRYDLDEILYEEYTGVVYYHGTNTVVPDEELTPTTMYIHDSQIQTKRRTHERKWNVNI